MGLAIRAFVLGHSDVGNVVNPAVPREFSRRLACRENLLENQPVSGKYEHPDYDSSDGNKRCTVGRDLKGVQDTPCFLLYAV